MAMRWYARPDNNAHELRVAPRLASWNTSGDPDQVRLRAYLDDTEALLAASRIDGLRALRLDVDSPLHVIYSTQPTSTTARVHSPIE